jgi:uncharacterized protein YceK
MKKIVVVLASLILMVGCMPIRELSLAQKEYLSQASRHPIDFVVPKSRRDEAWGRAQVFVSKYSSMKPQLITDYIIQTYTPTGPAVEFGYVINCVPIGDSLQFSIRCSCGNQFTPAGEASQNEHIASLYIDNGILYDPTLIFQ